MKYAPVVIPTLNRYEKMRECLESLARCKWAEYTDVYVGLDYPPSEEYADGYAENKAYLESFVSPFRSFHLFVRESNFGAGRNPRQIIDELIWPNYDRLIYSEDDNVFAETFLQYMNLGLEKLENDHRILQIGGFAIPADWVDDGSEDIVLMNSNINAWGFGIWRDRWKALQAEAGRPNYYHEILSSKERKQRILSGSNNDCGAMAWYVMMGCYTVNDTFKSIYARDKGMYGVYPKKSKVRNTGTDGSGMSSGKMDLVGVSHVQVDDAHELPEDLFDDLPSFHEENFASINAIYPFPAWKKAFVRFVFSTHEFWLRNVGLGKKLRKLYTRLNPRL